MEFKDRVSNKPNRFKITQESNGESFYAKVEIADEPIENGTPLNKATFDKLQKELNAYVAGNILITSKNENPTSYLGGTWELIDKNFKPFAGEVSDAFIDTDEAVVETLKVCRSGSMIRLNFLVVTFNKLTDTNKLLGEINLDKLGITSLPFGNETLFSYNDGANCGVVSSLHADGKLYHLDVFNKASYEDGLGRWVFDITTNVTKSSMIDEFCDKFYWKRIS